MQEFDQNKTHLHHDPGLSELSFMGKRRVFMGEAAPATPAPGPSATPATKQAETFDINSPEFDDIAFKTEKKTNYLINDGLDYTIEMILKNELKLQNTNQRTQLKSEFFKGLIESLERNKKNFPTQETNEISDTEQWFRMILTKQNCKNIGLVYDPINDMTVFKFYNDAGEIKFPNTDIKIQYIPKTLKEAKANKTDSTPTDNPKQNEINEIPIGKQKYVVLKNITTQKTYLEIAEAILDSTKNGKIDDKQLIPAETCADIRATQISIPEYAALLQKAHKANGTQYRLPIIMPYRNSDRTGAIRKLDEGKTRETYDKFKNTQDAVAKFTELRTVQYETDTLTPAQKQKIQEYFTKCEIELYGTTEPKAQEAIIQSLLDNLDDYFREAGFRRDISKGLENVMDAGKDGIAWIELWTKENPTVTRIMKIIEENRDVFGTIPKNTVRGIVYEMIRTGNHSSFDSGDIIKYFHIDLPVTSKEYDEVLGLATISQDSKCPLLAEKQKKCREFANAIEGLSRAISQLDPSQNQDVAALDRGHTALDKTIAEATGAKNLQTMVSLLNVDKSSPIRKKEGNEQVYSCIIEKGGKKLNLQIDSRWNGQFISAFNYETGQELWSKWDNLGFNAPDYVDKINTLISTQAVSKKAVKSGETIEEMDVKGQGAYYSLRSLESLTQSIPGMPVKDLLDKSEKDKRIDNKLALKTKEILTELGVIDTAKFVDTPESLTKLKDDNQTWINIRYKGKDFTLHINNALVGWGVRMKSGFNQDAENGDIALSSGKSMNSERIQEVHQGIDKIIAEKVYNNAEVVPANIVVGRIGIMDPAVQSFNEAIKKYKPTPEYNTDLTLTVSQMMEVIFRTYTFEELKAQNCVKKVQNKEQAYILTEIPPALLEIGKLNNAEANKTKIGKIANLIYAVKYGGMEGTDIRDNTLASREARESINAQAKYDRQLQEIFAVGLVDFDAQGRKVNMGVTNTNAGSVTGYSENDEYFRKVDGKAAYNDFKSQTRRREEGTNKEIIDKMDAEARLYNLYNKGKTYLATLARTNPYYQEVQKRLADSGETRNRFNLDLNFTDLDKQIIRLGYLADTVERENAQLAAFEQVKEKLIENILKLLPDEVENPTTHKKVDKKELNATLRQLPVGVLINYSHSYDKITDKTSNSIGVTAPIILDVFNSDGVKLILAPGFSYPEGIRFAVGLAFQASVHERVKFFGGVSLGVGTNFKDSSMFGAAIGGGVDFKIVKADAIDNYNHYLGIRAGVGFDFKNVLGGVSMGPAYKFEIDAQQKYKNTLNERLEKEGVLDYINRLTQIYKKNPRTGDSIEKYCSDLKNDKTLAPKIGVSSNTSDKDVLIAFEQYIAGLMDNFNKTFDLPRILGGEFGIGIEKGVIIAVGAATGNVPLILGTVGVWAIQILASLNFNVGSRMVIAREQKTSEIEMGAFIDQDKQKQFNKAFDSIDKSQAAQQYFTSGQNTLDDKGAKSTSVEVKEYSTEIAMYDIGKKIITLNQQLIAKGIDMILKKTDQGFIEIVMLDSNLASNDRFLFGEGLVVYKDGRFYLADPNKIKYLYFDKQTRKYPLETSHGATMESVTTISDNRYFKGDSFPTSVNMMRYFDNKERPIIESNLNGEPKKYESSSYDFKSIEDDQKAMKGALQKTPDIETTESRKDLKALALKMNYYRTKNGDTFRDITMKKAVSNLNKPDQLSERLYAFYDKFMEENKITPVTLNSHDKQTLTLELSKLRYTLLLDGKEKEAEKNEKFRQRLNWAKETMTPYFNQRIRELTGKVLKTTKTGTELAAKAVNDCLTINPSSTKFTKLEPGTSVGVAIGVNGRGLHQILDAAGASKDYGYLMSKIDYSEALRTGLPADDHDIAMILMDQLSVLPAKTDVKNFMDSNIARKLASNGGLRFILGHDEYMKVVEYYKNPSTPNPQLDKFMNLVIQLRDAEQKGEELISVKGEKDVNFNIKVIPHLRTGVFSKCANFTAAITEDVTIIPPQPEEAMALLATSEEAITTLDAKAYKQFLGFFGGVTASVALDYSPIGKDTPGTTEKTGGGGVGKENAGKEGGKNGLAGPQKPGEAASSAPTS